MEENKEKWLNKLAKYIKYPLSKIKDSFKDPKIKKRIAALVLSTGISVAPLTACSCAKTDNNITPSSSVSDVINNDSSSQSTSIEDNEYSQYSQILQTVLTDSYYTGLVATATSKVQGESGDKTYAVNNNKYTAIPYGFLKQQGYNIASIKNNDVECISNVYTKGNELYIELKVEHKSSIDYYANFLIKYTLNKQELDDLNMLFSGSLHYYEGAQFIQELSYQKTANLISVQYMGKEAQKTAEENIKHYIQYKGEVDKSGFENSNASISSLLTSVDKENETLTFYVHLSSSGIKNTNKVTLARFYPFPLNFVNYDNNILVTDFLYDPIMWPSAITQFNNSKFNATFYNSNNTAFTSVLTDRDLTNNA